MNLIYIYVLIVKFFIINKENCLLIMVVIGYLLCLELGFLVFMLYKWFDDFFFCKIFISIVYIN